jgi:uroporphyrinogen III methyltransferase/synthase
MMRMTDMDGWVAFIGVGPGDEGLLTMRAVRLLAAAGLVVADPETTDRIRHLLAADAEITEPGDAAATARALLAAAASGRLAARVYEGDPLLNGGVAEVAAVASAGNGAKDAKDKVRYEIVPGMPPAITVPAYAGLPLATEGVGEIRVIDASEASQITCSAATLVVTGAETAPADLGKMLIAAGWPDTTPLAITWGGTTTEQQTIMTSLGRVGPDLKAAGASVATTYGRAVAVVGEAASAKSRLSWYETKPLFGWRVLVPRTREQAAVVSERLREYGAVPEEVPTIAVEPPRTPQQMERAVKGLVTGRFQWVAFTSVNAVKAVREKLVEYGLDARAFAGVKVAAVGEQTCKALLEFGIRPDLVPEGQQSAEGLADAWPPYDDVLDPINRVLLPRADIATEALVGRLSELGWEPEDVTAYRTVRAAPPAAPIREAIKGGGFDAVLFTSSSTVRNLVGIAGKPHAVTVIGVIGPQTAKTADDFGLRVDVQSAKPSVLELVDALAEFGRKQRETAAANNEPLRRPSERRRGARKRLAIK